MPKVVSGFKCPYTKKIYRVGEEYTGQHIEEMQKKGYIAFSTNNGPPKAKNEGVVRKKVK